MKIEIYGCRGSLPSPSGRLPDGKMFETKEFGGNTTCLYLETDNSKKIIIDAGTGIRQLGRRLMSEGDKKNLELYVTHTHWDHIQGFPFFVPAYIKGNKIDIYGEAKVTGDLVNTIKNSNPNEYPAIMQINGDGMKKVFSEQQNPRNFPAPLEYMAGLGEFFDFISGGTIKQEESLKIETKRINHPLGCVSYKFTEEKEGKKKVMIIATDFEPNNEDDKNEIIEWWKGADVVISDGQYETGSKENPFMKNYGHSDPFLDVDFAIKAGIKKLIITHHDPNSEDNYLNGLEQRVKKYAEEKTKNLEVVFAREGEKYWL